MTVVAGPFFAAAGLLGAAGAMKVVQPASAVEALRAARLPGSRSRRPIVERLIVGRVLGMVEVLIAVAAVVFGGRATAALLAAVYLGFALFTARLLHTAEAGASCGCFGAESSPAAPLHAVVNGGIALLAASAVAWPTAGLADVLRHQPLGGFPFLGLCAVFGWLLFAVLTALPELQAAIADVPARHARTTVR